MRIMHLVSLLLLSAFAFAQKGNKVLQMTGNAIIPVLQEPAGFGLSLKGLYRVNRNGLLLLVSLIIN
ncbi:hypothetical protein [Parafilimonas sp.]|uniref:hypothetical protein n=1 Tax=Parafilimonas sp. TaxID=1969739 RepID=UPI003F816269